MATINWAKALQPLLAKYSGKAHPLDYKNLYQLVDMVILSAQDSDKNINNVNFVTAKILVDSICRNELCYY